MAGVSAERSAGEAAAATWGYDAVEHRHRFAAWAAGTAARSSPKCRFTVKSAIEILQESGVYGLLRSTDDIPLSQQDFDLLHSQLCNRAIAAAQHVLSNGAESSFSFGVAAKLINVYLKAGLGCLYGAPLSPMAVLHPPVDRVLLDGLAQVDFGAKRSYWRRMSRKGWSTFTVDEYGAVIRMIAQSLPRGVCLWAVEKYWSGHQ